MNITRTLSVLATASLVTATSTLLHAQTSRGSDWEAPHAPLPLIGSEGGPILTAAKVVPIYYAADSLAPDLGSYFAKLTTSKYLARALASYGITSVTVGPAVVLADPPPASMLDTDIATWLLSEIASGALPAADANTMYQVVYPAATVVNTGGLYGESYQTCYPFSFEAYPASGSPIPFGVVPLCEGATPGLTDIETDTYNSTMVIADTVTDPFQYEVPGYQDPSWSGSGWSLMVGDQAGTLCYGDASTRTTTPSDLGYVAATIWSNANARAGRNPCPDYASAPETQGAYFNAAPDIQGGTNLEQFLAVKGLILPVAGGSVKVPVRLFSDRPMGSWSISASERTDIDGQPSPVLTFSFDRASGTNGDVRTLTITRAAAAAGSLAYPTEVVPLVFEITSTAGTASHGWLGIVGNE